MSTLPKPKDRQEWQRLPPRRKSYPELFMQIVQSHYHSKSLNSDRPINKITNGDLLFIKS